MCYHAFMASTRRTGQGRARAGGISRPGEHRRAAVAHYRSFLQFRKEGEPIRPFRRGTDEGRYAYNPLLDEPKAEGRNYLGWEHGYFQGYDQAGCRCPSCSAANSEHVRGRLVRMERKLREDAGRRLATLLPTLLPTLPGDNREEVIAAVVATGEAVGRRRTGESSRVEVTFRPADVALALWSAWREADPPSAPAEPPTELAARLTDTLNAGEAA